MNAQMEKEIVSTSSAEYHDVREIHRTTTLGDGYRGTTLGDATEGQNSSGLAEPSVTATEGRCHELLGNRAGQLSLDLRGQYRLLFAPGHAPAVKRADGGLNWTQVTAVVVIGVEDTHD